MNLDFGESWVRFKIASGDRVTKSRAVKTGKYRTGDETRDGLKQPDEVCESFAEWVNDLLLIKG
jgi:hypothetical protein